MKNREALPLVAVLRWLAQRKTPDLPWRTESAAPDDFQPTDVHVRAALPVPDEPVQTTAAPVVARVERLTNSSRLQKLEEAIHQAELRVERMRRLTDRLAESPRNAHAYAQHALECSLTLLHELIRARSALQRQHFASIRAQLSEPEPGALPIADAPGRPVRADSTGESVTTGGDLAARRRAS